MKARKELLKAFKILTVKTNRFWNNNSVGRKYEDIPEMAWSLYGEFGALREISFENHLSRIYQDRQL